MTESQSTKSYLLGKGCTLMHFSMKKNSEDSACRRCLQLQRMCQQDKLHMFAGTRLQWWTKMCLRDTARSCWMTSCQERWSRTLRGKGNTG